MRLSAAHVEAIVEAINGVSYGRVIIEICESSPNLDILVEKRMRLPRDTDPTLRAGKVVRVGLKQQNIGSID